MIDEVLCSVNPLIVGTYLVGVIGAMDGHGVRQGVVMRVLEEDGQHLHSRGFGCPLDTVRHRPLQGLAAVHRVLARLGPFKDEKSDHGGCGGQNKVSLTWRLCSC